MTTDGTVKADFVTKLKLEFAGLGRRWSEVELEGMSLAALLYHALVERTEAMPGRPA